MSKVLLAKAYHDGLREGLEMYAHWRDGTQYVGTCGKTLKQALAEIDKQEADIIAGLEDRREVKSSLGYSRVGLGNV
jgi:hypothetical protein